MLREYNALGKVSSVTDKMGRTTQLSYDSMWNLARVTTPDGAKTTYIYNEHNLLTRIKYADGAVVRHTYDANGNRIGTEDENGSKTSFIYDAIGRMTEIYGPEGEHYIYTYDGEGNMIAAEDACGNKVLMEYDANGNLIRETNPLGESCSYTYTPLGDVRSVTDSAGRVTGYRYYPGGQLESILHPDGKEEKYTYDENGNVKTYTAPTGFVMTYEYDSLDRIVCIRGDEGESKHYTYDAAGNITSMIDGLGNVTRYGYSLSGQLTKVTDALGNETEYRYDETDRLIEIRQYGEFEGDCALQAAEEQNRRKCQITRYKRNLRGLVEEVTDALGQKERYQYDRKGQLLSRLDREGYLTRYSWTRSGEPAGIQYADGRAVKYGYNALRQLTEVQDWIGTIRIEPDAVGRAKKVVYPDGRAVSYTYGAAGVRTSLTYPDGKTVYYGYDRNLRLTEMKEGDRLITYDYDEAGRLAKKNFPNGMESICHYDRKGQLLELCHKDGDGILDRYTYEYDLIGNKTSIVKERRGLTAESGAYHYGYDPLGRLSEIRKDGKIQTRYSYDAFGNRTYKEGNGESILYRHNALNQLISETGNGTEKSYFYDRRGNMSRITENGSITYQYVYGALDRLEEAVNSTGNAARYQYNGLGHRVGKSEGVINRREFSEPDPQKGVQAEIRNICQINYMIDLTREYHNLLEKEEENHKQRFFWDGSVSAYEENGRCRYYLQDELGSPLRITGTDGTLKETYGYGAFGEDLYGNQGMIQPFGYTGYQRDEVAGTYYAQAREYSVELGVFCENDIISGKITAPLTLNRYAYCYGMPLRYTDLSGKLIEDITRLLAKIIIGNPINAYVTQQGWFKEAFYAAGFTRDSKGIYHARQDALQQYGGYNDFYDAVFDAATSMNREKYQFSYDNEDYIIWVWKGDYLNLGAGAEMGIYRRAGETNHWIVDHNLEMPMTLKLYNGIDEVFTYSPTEEQWWITGFNPYIQNVNANDLTAIYTIDFSDFEDLYESFIKSDDYLRNKSKWHISEENKYILTFTWRGEECVE